MTGASVRSTAVIYIMTEGQTDGTTDGQTGLSVNMSNVYEDAGIALLAKSSNLGLEPHPTTCHDPGTGQIRHDTTKPEKQGRLTSHIKVMPSCQVGTTSGVQPGIIRGLPTVPVFDLQPHR